MKAIPKIFFILILFSSLNTLQSQIYYQDNFDTTEDWLISQSGQWNYSQSLGVNGSICLKSTLSEQASNDERIVNFITSPLVDFSEVIDHESIKVSWKMKMVDNGDIPSKSKVKLFISLENSPENLIQFFDNQVVAFRDEEISISSSNWTDEVGILSDAFEGQKVHFTFAHYTDEYLSESTLLVDDFKISVETFQGVQLRDIVVEPHYFYKDSFEIKGGGINRHFINGPSITSVKIQCLVNDSDVVTSTFDLNDIKPGKEFGFKFEELIALEDFDLACIKLSVIEVNGLPETNRKYDRSENCAIIYRSERKVLVEEFTSLGCGPCIDNLENHERSLFIGNGKYSAITYHTDIPIADYLYTESPEPHDNQKEFYNVFGNPFAEIDGVYSYNLKETRIQRNSEIGAPLKVHLSYDIVESNNTIDVTVNIINESSLDYLVGGEKLKIALVEDIPNEINPHIGSNNVTRTFITPYEGVVFDNVLGNSEITLEFENFEIPEVVRDYSKLNVIAYIQNNESKEVINSISSKEQETTINFTNLDFVYDLRGPEINWISLDPKITQYCENSSFTDTIVIEATNNVNLISDYFIDFYADNEIFYTHHRQQPNWSIINTDTVIFSDFELPISGDFTFFLGVRHPLDNFKYDDYSNQLYVRNPLQSNGPISLNFEDLTSEKSSKGTFIFNNKIPGITGTFGDVVIVDSLWQYYIDIPLGANLDSEVPLYVPFYNGPGTDIGDVFEFHLSQQYEVKSTDATLEFDLCYKKMRNFADPQYNEDKMEIEVSTDCGETFSVLKSFGTDSLMTAMIPFDLTSTYDPENYVPRDADEWKRIIISLKDYINETIIIRFSGERVYGTGSIACYMDNILVSSPSETIDNDGDGVFQAFDCDDNDSNNFPGNIEICDDQDNNCDGSIDEGISTILLYADTDDDGYGDPLTFIETCFPSISGFVDNGEDCNDLDPNINPTVTEIPNNGIDENCDGIDLVSAIYELANTTINIYPNPTINLINIKIEGNLDFTATIYDLNGKAIKKVTNTNQVDINSLPQGTYLLEIKDLESGQKIIERIVIGR